MPEPATIILANGQITYPEQLKARVQKLEIKQVIAADGGYRLGHQLGLSLNVILGDLDSFDHSQRGYYENKGVQFVEFPPEKDETDLELALLCAVENGAKRIVLIGGLGGRLDMSLSNVLLLSHPGLATAHIEIWVGEQTAWLIMPPGEDIHGQAGDTLSLIPLGGSCEGITTHHLQYSLKDESLEPGPARGISNVLTADHARVDLKQGTLLAIHTPGRA